MSKKIIPLVFAMILIFSTISFAELDINEDGRTNKDKSIYSKIMSITFPQEDRFLSKNIIIDLNLDCEDIGSWNIANPDYQVLNVSFRTIYNHRTDNTLFSSSIPTYETLFTDYGCSNGSPTCDTGNTPITNKVVEYNIRDGETLSIQEVTYFINNTITDSPCNFRITSISQNCRGCSSQTYEQTIKSLDTRKSTFDIKNGIYSIVNNSIDFNFMIWNIISWIIKIGIMFFVILGCIYLLFYFVYYLREKIK